MTKEQEQVTYNERKSAELQRDLEEAYSPVSKVRETSLLTKVLNAIAKYFGLE